MQVSCLPDLERYSMHRPALAAMLDPRCYTIEWLDEQILSGKFTLWTNDSAVLITELRTYPAGAREVHAMTAGGTLEGISELRERAEQWARGEGVEFASAASRPGWAQVLKPFGYEMHQVEVRKEL